MIDMSRTFEHCHTNYFDGYRDVWFTDNSKNSDNRHWCVSYGSDGSVATFKNIGFDVGVGLNTEIKTVDIKGKLRKLIIEHFREMQ